MKFKFVRFFYRVMLWWIVVWSKTYRYFVQPLRKYKLFPLDKYHTPGSAWERLKHLQYRKDDWSVLRDVINRPEHVQMAIQCNEIYGVQFNGPMDCDDFAIWAVNVIDKSWDPKILCLSFQRKDGSLGGHAVCLTKSPLVITGCYYHVGNWGVWGPYKDMTETIESMLKVTDSRLIGWAVFSKDLKLLKWGKEL